MRTEASFNLNLFVNGTYDKLLKQLYSIYQCEHSHKIIDLNLIVIASIRRGRKCVIIFSLITIENHNFTINEVI